MTRKVDVDALCAGVLAGDRKSLARSITLVESTRADDEQHAHDLIERILPHTGRALRVGISGTPGVGKSSFIEALGTKLVDGGMKLAVLAVDPSSPRSHGSILGDKTRMELLSRHPSAFIRPSPSGGALGGVARHTREALLLCDAAGFDAVLVETVGVGQSEAAVAALVDTFVLLVAPGGGDDLQGVKRGVLELVDLIVVNKADGEHTQEARQTQQDYALGSRFFTRSLPTWDVPVLLASARNDTGLLEVWSAIQGHRAALESSNVLLSRRAAQGEAWMWSLIENELMRSFRSDAVVQALLPSLVDEVQAGRRSPVLAAGALLRAYREPSSTHS